MLAILEARRKAVPKSYLLVFANPEGSLITEAVRKLRLGRLAVPPKTKRDKWPDLRGHDLRRTLATRLAELGIDRPTISAVLGHVDASVTGRHYDVSSHVLEKRGARSMGRRA